MTSVTKDKDPILEQKFFDFLFPLAYPEIESDGVIYNFCKQQLSMQDALLPAGALLEKAISVQKRITRHATIGKDFVDGSDAKSASARWYSNNTSYGAPIHDIFNKKGLLRCVVYERLRDKFYYFLIPHRAYANIPKTSNIEIPFNMDGSPRRSAKGIRNVDWWLFEVTNFDGILRDATPEFEFVWEIKAKIKEQRQVAKEEQKKLKDVLPKKRSRSSTKNRPNLKRTSPYTITTSRQKTRDSQEKLPISLSD